MILPTYIKPYPRFFKYLPISDQGFNTLMGKTIYVSKNIYEDLKKQNPDPLSIAVLIHQEIHAQNPSLFKTCRFIFSKKFRLTEEEKAYTAMFSHLKQHGETFDLDRVAQSFNSIRYLWLASSYEEGMSLIMKIWQQA